MTDSELLAKISTLSSEQKKSLEDFVDFLIYKMKREADMKSK